ncbi:MAG: aspartate aminotransferase family protein [Candidatus Eremiobacteraeota bacterium]|nr:aspartate aminotransferase family protein [Candidatus Eremiobacteraeota bacterium]MCW5869160.1 aspartate aminotransferase family protein [Candidatus Eremiobacteraeota bacterium]
MFISQAGLDLLQEALNHLGNGFSRLPPAETRLDVERLRPVLLEVAGRMRDNYPYHHPLYAGQMLKPPHPLARLAYALAQFINPNNHALDGGRASSALEKEAVAEISAMLGWSEHLGHLTSGGTFANLEALWIAGCLHPGKRILASSQAHYTHQRICGVLQLPFSPLAVDPAARLDLASLEAELAKGDVGTIVVTLGTSAVGAVDPLHLIFPLAERYGVRVHVDAAYGGYFRLAESLGGQAARAFAAVPRAHSLAIDPHKHGMQPYGCGCVLFRDPSVGRFYKHDSPYTYFSSAELHLGEISLECSRPGAAAVALWATQRLLPLERGGELGQRLDQSLKAARGLAGWLKERPEHWKLLFEPELDLVVWAPQGTSAGEVSRKSQAIFEKAAELDLHLAVTQVSQGLVWPELDWDQPRLACLRSCLMKPEHLEWLPEICARLELAAASQC